MKAADNKSAIFAKHLAILVRLHDDSVRIYLSSIINMQRKFVRQVPHPKQMKSFHSFKEWLSKEFPGNNIDWDTIMREDERYDYSGCSSDGSPIIYENEDGQELESSSPVAADD